MISLYEVSFKRKEGFLLVNTSENLEELKKKYQIKTARRVPIEWSTAYYFISKLEKIPLLNKHLLDYCNFSLEIDYDEYDIYYYHLAFPMKGVRVSASMNELDELIDIQIDGIEYDPDIDDIEEKFLDLFLNLKADRPYEDIIDEEYLKNFDIEL